ncbi:MAG: hypothetical protein HYZ10_12130 [Ignavibacteriales bacterium]|nr:hypothetical protein [Ignavibacteriales bacterium]
MKKILWFFCLSYLITAVSINAQTINFSPTIGIGKVYDNSSVSPNAAFLNLNAGLKISDNMICGLRYGAVGTSQNYNASLELGIFFKYFLPQSDIFFNAGLFEHKNESTKPMGSIRHTNKNIYLLSVGSGYFVFKNFFVDITGQIPLGSKIYRVTVLRNITNEVEIRSELDFIISVGIGFNFDI